MAQVRTDPLFEQQFTLLRSLVDDAEHETGRGAWKDSVKALSYCKRQLVVMEAQAMLLRDGALSEEGEQRALPGTGPAAENYAPPAAEDDPGLRFLGTEAYTTMLELVEQAGAAGMTTTAIADQLEVDEGQVYQMAEFAFRRGTFERDGAIYTWLGEGVAIPEDEPEWLNDELYAELKQELQQAGTAGMTSDALAKAVQIDAEECYRFCEWFHNRRGCRREGSAYIWLDDPDDDPFEDDVTDDPEQRIGLHAVEPETEPDPLPDGVSEALEPAGV